MDKDQNRPHWEPPLHKAVWYAAQNFRTSFMVVWSCYDERRPDNRIAEPGHNYMRCPRWVTWFSRIALAPVFGFVQAWGHFGIRPGWPSWPWRVVGPIEDWAHRIIERREQWFVWLPPDSGEPFEVGLHARQEEIQYGERDPETCVRPILSRPRCFQYPAPKYDGPGTYGSGATIVYLKPAATPGAAGKEDNA